MPRRSGLALVALVVAACQPAAPAVVDAPTNAPTVPPTLAPTALPLSSTGAPTLEPTVTVAPTAEPALAPPTVTTRPAAPLLFDDFAYAGPAALEANGWVVRSAPGWPGVPGATWWPEGVTLLDSDERPGDGWVRLAAATDGTAKGTRQAQFCHQRKYLEGTYAARVRFSDVPTFGPDGDQVVQTFYTISPLAYDLDPNYSELDFEYLPNGGWGSPAHTFHFTTWETFRPEPNWLADNISGQVISAHGGAWHTLVLTVLDGEVRYFVDGVPRAVHGDQFYPEVPMSLNFNLWFIRDGQVAGGEERLYEEHIDWAFHHAGVALSTEDVEAAVAALRAAGSTFVDTVPPPEPPLETPCDF